MVARLQTRLEKLERTGGGDAPVAFYILWVTPGSDRLAALAELRKSGKVAAHAPAYCAEWKLPRDYARREHGLGPQPRSRLTNHQRINDDERRILFEALADDPEVRRVAETKSDPCDERTRQRIVEYTDRQLIGAIICGCCGEQGVGHDR